MESIAGIAIIPLVLGLVQFAKKLGVNGNGSMVLAVVLGFFFSGLMYAGQTGLIPAEALPWVELVVFALAGGLSAAGLYDLGKSWTGNGS